jgi:phage head maturation protease
MDAETIAVDTSRLICQSRVLALDEKARTVRHVISTAMLDRGNRIVDVGGWKLARFKANPIVLADHEYAIERVIGRAKDVKVEGDALMSTTEFASEGLGNVAFRLVQAGLVNAWSVGWIGLKSHRIEAVEDCPACADAMKKSKINWGTHYREQELLEYSLVTVPANPEAVMGLSTAGLVASNEADEWIAACVKTAASDPEPEIEPEVEPDPRIERSSAFYESVFAVSRSVARRSVALRTSQQVRRLS